MRFSVLKLRSTVAVPSGENLDGQHRVSRSMAGGHLPLHTCTQPCLPLVNGFVDDALSTSTVPMLHLVNVTFLFLCNVRNN